MGVCSIRWIAQKRFEDKKERKRERKESKCDMLELIGTSLLIIAFVIHNVGIYESMFCALRPRSGFERLRCRLSSFIFHHAYRMVLP